MKIYILIILLLCISGFAIENTVFIINECEKEALVRGYADSYTVKGCELDGIVWKCKCYKNMPIIINSTVDDFKVLIQYYPLYKYEEKFKVIKEVQFKLPEEVKQQIQEAIRLEQEKKDAEVRKTYSFFFIIVIILILFFGILAVFALKYLKNNLIDKED